MKPGLHALAKRVVAVESRRQPLRWIFAGVVYAGEDVDLVCRAARDKWLKENPGLASPNVIVRVIVTGVPR